MGPALFVALHLAFAIGQAPCSPAQIAVTAEAERRVLRGDDAGAGEVLSASVVSGTCDRLELVSVALDGWREARALAPAGGAADLLGPVQRALERLTPFLELDARLEAEYAQTAIRAAIAAAQDERSEMELLLTHARDLSERLQLRGRRAVWPRPLNLLAGELWFEVDRFDDARAAYQRAIAGDAAPAALIGLARALARLGHTAAACTTYKRAADAAPALRAAAAADLARRR
jgi:tetratricopeptide (TPR) repeat protein